MLESLEKIPKGVNIVIFIWAMIGLFLLLRNPKMRKEKLFLISLGILSFMAAWRVLFHISTSRYAAGLILPFVIFASYFLYNSRKRRHVLVRLVLYAAIACSGVIVLKMNLDSVTRHESAVAVSEVFRAVDGSGGNYMFRAPWKDFPRIYYFSRMKDGILGVYEPDTFILNYSNVFKDTVLYIETKDIWGNDREKTAGTDSGNRKSARVQEKLNRKYKLIASLVEDVDDNKKHFIYILSSDNRCVPVLKDRIPPYRPNLLDNGNLEELDTAEESREKLKSFLGDRSLPPDAAGPVAGTPRSVGFSVGPDSTTALPEVGIQNDSRIDGNNSARISIPDGTASMIFDRRFSNGDYEYSMLVQGKKGTTVRAVCEITKDGVRTVRQIATLLIPDGRLFLITTHFSVEDLGQDDFFQVGATVRNGEANLDNFSLTRVDAPDKD